MIKQHEITSNLLDLNNAAISTFPATLKLMEWIAIKSEATLNNFRQADLDTVQVDLGELQIKRAEFLNNQQKILSEKKIRNNFISWLTEELKNSLRASLYARHSQSVKRRNSVPLYVNNLTFTLTRWSVIGNCDITFDLIKTEPTLEERYDSMRITDNYTKISEILSLISTSGNKYSFSRKNSIIRAIIAIEIDSRLHTL